MNPLEIEQALVAALTTLLTDPAIGSIYTGTGYDILAPQSLNLIVACGSLDHVAGGVYKATITLRIESPSLLGADALATMQSVQGELLAALPSIGGQWSSSMTYGGIFVQNVKTSQSDHAWVSETEMLLGLSV
jgi:hypothetical protein